MFANKTKSGRCPKNYRNYHGNCVHKENYSDYVVQGRKKRCAPGTRRSRKTGECTPIGQAKKAVAKAKKTRVAKKCPPEKPYRSVTGACVARKPRAHKHEGKYIAFAEITNAGGRPKRVSIAQANTPLVAFNNAYHDMVESKLVRKKKNRISVAKDRAQMRSQFQRGVGVAISRRYGVHITVHRTDTKDIPPAKGCPPDKPFMGKRGCRKTRPKNMPVAEVRAVNDRRNDAWWGEEGDEADDADEDYVP